MRPSARGVRTVRSLPIGHCTAVAVCLTVTCPSHPLILLNLVPRATTPAIRGCQRGAVKRLLSVKSVCVGLITTSRIWCHPRFRAAPGALEHVPGREGGATAPRFSCAVFLSPGRSSVRAAHVALTQARDPGMTAKMIATRQEFTLRQRLVLHQGRPGRRGHPAMSGDTFGCRPWEGACVSVGGGGHCIWWLRPGVRLSAHRARKRPKTGPHAAQTPGGPGREPRLQASGKLSRGFECGSDVLRRGRFRVCLGGTRKPISE